MTDMNLGTEHKEEHDWKEKAERCKALATSTTVLLNLANKEIQMLNEKVEDLEEQIWELKKENLTKY